MKASFVGSMKISAIGTMVAACVLSAAAARAQSPSPVLLLLDQNAVAAGVPPNSFSVQSINATIAAIGVRDYIPTFFNGNAGQSVTLPYGLAGHEGWFTLSSAPSDWDSGPGAGDGLENFAVAGPGLGSPDVNGSRGSLLSSVPGVNLLTTANLRNLAGQAVCAVVYASELQPTASTTALDGPNLGTMAFSIVGATDADSQNPGSVQISLLDPSVVCGQTLTGVTPQP